MDVTSVLFYVFAAVLLFAAFRVITVRNPVYAALYLVLAFFQASGIWMLLQAEFLSITLVVVYVGAVMVLFLFVVMMLDINVDALRSKFWTHFPFAALVGVIIIAEMAAVLLGNFHETVPNPMRGADGMPLLPGASNTKELGRLLFTQYLLPVEGAAVLLLVAMVAAIALTLRKRKDSKYQSPAEQVRVRASDRVRILKMDVTLPAPSHAKQSDAVVEEKKA